MKFKEDWSLAYLLLYLCQIGYWLIVINLGVEVFTTAIPLNHESVIITDIPVKIELEQFEEHSDVELAKVYLNIPERMSTELNISGPYNELKGAFFFYNSLKIYESAVFFLILFMLSKVLRGVAEGDPFQSKNPFYLYGIGWILILSSLINIAIQFGNIGHLIPLPVLNDLNLPDSVSIPSLDMFGENFMLAGIFIIVLGYVFKEGARIYEEQKLTV